MSRDLRDLALVAVRGTSRAELPAPTGTLASALASVPGDTAEARLLGRAALLGLHARAGAPLLQAAAPPPLPLPAPACPLPPALWKLLPELIRTDLVLAVQALDTVAVRGWTLSAAQVLALWTQQPDLAHVLWTLADARAQATLGAHPLHRQAQKAGEEVAWQLSLAALAELRARDPAQAASEQRDLWTGLSPERRKTLLALVRRDPRPEDRPLLETATGDRSPDVQKQARQLLGYLSGPLQDELLVLLPQAVKVRGLLKKKLTFGAFDLPAALGKPRAGQDDSDLHRLLGALPTPLILKTLKVGWDELDQAVRAQHWSLPQELQEPVAPPAPPPEPDSALARLRGLAAQPNVSPEQLLDAVQTLIEVVDLSAQPLDLQVTLAARLLDLLQRGGVSAQTPELALLLRRHLSPDLALPPPIPLPFEPPPLPKTLPTWQTPADWEERQRRNHAQNEQAAFQVWRDLIHTLQLRREWHGALAAHPAPRPSEEHP